MKNLVLFVLLLIVNIINPTFTIAVNSANNPNITKYLPSVETDAVVNAPVNLFFVLDDSSSMMVWMFYDPTIKYILPPNPDGSSRQFDLPYPKAYSSSRISTKNNEVSNFGSTSTTTIPSSGIFSCNDGVVKPPATAEEKRNCQIWYSFYSKRALALQSALLIAMTDSLTDDWRIGWGTINPRNYRTKQHYLPVKKVSESGRKNFFEWLNKLVFPGETPTQYGLADAFKEVSTARGENDIYNRDPGISGKLMSCTQNYMVLLSDGDASYMTYKNVDSKNGNARITSTLYNNFVEIPNTANYDAFSADNGYLKFDVNDPQTKLYRKNMSSNYISLNDLALKYWHEDMRPDLPNNVSPLIKYPNSVNISTDKSSLSVNPEWYHENDPATWQHFVTYAITLGNVADITMKNHKKLLNKRYLGELDWGDGIHDVAQAGYSGRGGYHAVESGDELTNAFERIRNDIYIRSKIETKAGALSITQSTSDAKNLSFHEIFSNIKRQNSFIVANDLFSGDPDDLFDCFADVYENQVYSEGMVCTKNQPRWSTEKTKPFDNKATDWDERYIITSTQGENNNTLSVRLKFDASSLTSEQQNRLTPNDGTTSEMINYIHGDSQKEPTWLFRGDVGSTRNLLGDISRASGLFIGQLYLPSNELYKEKTFVWRQPIPDAQSKIENYGSNFRRDKLKKKKILVESAPLRMEMIYTLSNDGMLHGFRANNVGGGIKGISSKFVLEGEEVFAYLPDALFDLVKDRTANNYTGAVFNGQLSYADTYAYETVGDDEYPVMQSIIVGGFGSGAKGLFALDVTNPQRPAVLWEKTQELDDKLRNTLGHIMQRPSIVHLPDGRWAAIVGSGVGHESNSSSLLVYEISTGEKIQQITLPESVGLNNTVAIVTDNRSKYYSNIVYSDIKNKTISEQVYRQDRIYAGDLLGNLWTFQANLDFDINGKTKETQFKAEKLFVATDKDDNVQAITTEMLVNKHPTGFGYMVYFGTGEMYDKERLYDNQDSMYGVWDANHIDNKPVFTRSDLQLNSWETVTNTKGDKERVIVDSKEINWAYATENDRPYGNPSSRAVGWVIDTGVSPYTKVSETIWQAPVGFVLPSGQIGVSFLMSALSNNGDDTVACKGIDNEDTTYTWKMSVVTSGVKAGSDSFYVDADRNSAELVKSKQISGLTSLAGTSLGSTGSSGVLARSVEGVIIPTLVGNSCDSSVNYILREDGTLDSFRYCQKRTTDSWREIN